MSLRDAVDERVLRELDPNKNSVCIYSEKKAFGTYIQYSVIFIQIAKWDKTSLIFLHEGMTLPALSVLTIS